ncbi:unnamed protein product, partial [Allacma fusca]
DNNGPCKKGEWVVPHKDRSPSCERITCPERYEDQLKEEYYQTSSSRFIFPHDDECYQAYSQEGSFCRSEEIVFFIGGDSFNLHCSESLVCGVSTTPDTDCRDNSAPDFQGGCEPVTVL